MIQRKFKFALGFATLLLMAVPDSLPVCLYLVLYLIATISEVKYLAFYETSFYQRRGGLIPVYESICVLYNWILTVKIWIFNQAP